MSTRRIAAVIRKDLRENGIVFLIALLIPLSLILFTLRPQSAGFTEMPYAGSLRPLYEKQADVLVDASAKVLYTAPLTPELYHHLSRQYSAPKDIEIEVRGAQSQERVFGAFLLSVLFWIMSLITQPILMLSESRDGLHDALMMTHLSYFEYQLSKTVLAFAGALVSLLGFALILGAALSAWALIALLLGALCSVCVSLLLAALARDTDRLILINTPLAMLFVFAEAYAFMTARSLHSPVQSVFMQALGGAEPRWIPMGIILAAALGSYALAYRLTRQIGRRR